MGCASERPILLAADAGAGDQEIARNVGVGGSSVYRTKRRFVLGNLEAALSEAPRPGASRIPKAQHIRVVLDNLSTHSAGAL